MSTTPPDGTFNGTLPDPGTGGTRGGGNGNRNGNGNGGGNGGFSSIFQSAGGPPLILVCIAAGLLLGAFVGVLIMRRMRPGAVLVHRVNGARQDPAPKLGEKPKLLDIHLTPDQEHVPHSSWAAKDPGESAGDGSADVAARDRQSRNSWEHVSPFAALFLDPPVGPNPAPDTPPAHTRTLRSRLVHPIHLLPRFIRPRTTPSKSVLPISLAPSAGAAAGEGKIPLRAVQLAVTVLMPSPHAPRHVSRPSRDSDSVDEGALPDCVIGTRRVLCPADAPNEPETVVGAVPLVGANVTVATHSP